MLDVFDFRDQVISEYAAISRSFTRISAGPLPTVLTALCTLRLLIYSLDQEKYRVIKQALSQRKKAMNAEGA